MEDMILKVPCPNDTKQCTVSGGKVMETVILLGDEKQNMQCLTCGYGSNNNMKEHISDNPFPQEFKDVCVKLNDRFWAPSVFTTANYNVNLLEFLLPRVETDGAAFEFGSQRDGPVV